MVKKAVMIYGAPGAGKGTQANLLAWSKGFLHFDTGKYLEQIVHDPENQKNPKIKEQAKLFDTGILLDPSWVLNVVKEKTKEIASAGFSIVYSGSPRTTYEAFGDADLRGPNADKRGSKSVGLIDLLEKLYGKKNIFVILLKVRPKSSIFRNSNRKVCSVCATPILYSEETHKHRNCPLCGGKLRTRTLDKPEIIKTRLKEYENRTKPITIELKKHGYKILEINGEPAPNKVHFAILKKLGIK